MAKREINLLPTQTRLAKEREQKLKKIILVLTLSILSLFFLLNLGLFFYGTNLKNQAVELSAKAKKQEGKIESFQNKERLIYATREKLATLAKIFTTLAVPEENLKEILALLPVGATLESFSQDSQELTVAVLTPDAQTLGEFLKSLTNKDKFSEVKINALNRRGQGGYKADFRLKRK